MRRRRLTKRDKRSKQKKVIVMSVLCLLLVMTAGYAAFQTNLSITAKGNIVKLTGAKMLRNLCNTESGDGLYKDIYEENRCVYRGADPNNYITLANNIYRIIAVEADGTIKVIGDGLAEEAYWNVNSSAASWKEASLNSYLNTEYYDELDTSLKNIIVNHQWNVGQVYYPEQKDFATQIANEKSSTTWGNIGLLSASDYTKASINEACTSIDSYLSNSSCYSNSSTHNYLSVKQNYWTITPGYYGRNTGVYTVIGSHGGYINVGRIGAPSSYTSSRVVKPVFYLSSDIILEGQGTKDNPYKIVN